jgi:glycerophosphoryl diester phosphodiesterase
MAAKDVLVIAHRGASGYLPEHTLEAKAYAYALGADFIEQDLVATRDDELIVIHDIHLDRVTNVAEAFPERARADGRYYARDFDLAEIRRLEARERSRADGKTPVFDKRFPLGQGRFRVPTFKEEIALIQGLNRSTGRDVGIYPEIKNPAWHREHGVDLSRLVLEALAGFGYRAKTDNVFVQCFDYAECQRIRGELRSELRLIQLLDLPGVADTPGSDYEFLASEEGLKEIAVFADGVGPWLGYLARIADIDGQPVSTGFVSRAHALNLLVHPWTFRAEELIPGMENLEEMVRWCVEELRIDGLFTDFPDQAIAGIDA